MASRRRQADAARPGRLWAIALLLAGCAIPVPFATELLFRTDRPQLPVARDCARCHREVVEEWEGSGHASAWTSETFLRATASRRAPACLPCHAPAPLGEAGEISLRDDHRHEGVTCVSCHLSTQYPPEELAMRGPHPRTGPVDVHPVIVDPLYLEPDLCGTCHQRAFDEWKDTEHVRGESPPICQDCHMPGIRRKIESYDPEHPYSALIVSLARKIDGRRHLFAVPTDVDDDELGIEMTRVPPRGLRVRIRNELPHGIPTGGFGPREARIRTIWPGGEHTKRMRLRLGQQITAGTALEFEVDGVPELAPVQIRLERLRSDGTFELITLLEAAEK